MSGVRTDRAYLAQRNARIYRLRESGLEVAVVAERFRLSRREVYDICVAERKRKGADVEASS
jgi:Mor family transcriptional regulator